MLIEVSISEVIDKFLILQIKKNKIKNESKLININNEYNSLLKHIDNLELKLIINEYNELLIVNLLLWDVEDNIRLKENKNEFDDSFITLARDVYHLNDKRAKLKKEINLILNSNLIEEKSYE